MPRLRRSDCSGPGIARIRRGRGFSYRYADGRPVEDRDELERIRSLAVPPAWRDVWICLDELGHLQATGTDAAERKQYLYHPLWHERRDRAKFDRMLRFGEAQPKLRRRVARALRGGEEASRERVLACAVRLLDLGLFRVGSDEYAEEHGSFGLTTLRKEHVSVDGGSLSFSYPSKSGVKRLHVVHEPRCAELVTVLKGRRGGPELLAYREDRRWQLLHAQQINDYVKAALGEEFSAKDFRTWNGTVIAAAALSASARAAPSSNGTPRASTKTSRERAVRGAIQTVAESLGNTPAIARRSYIDPRVFDRYRSGWVISIDPDHLHVARDRDRRVIERAVLDLLSGDRGSDGVERALPPLRTR